MTASQVEHMTQLGPEQRDRAEIVVEGGRGMVTPAALLELWRFREVLGAFVVRQVLARDKQAAVGVGWSVIQPVATALLFALFLGRYVHIASEGVPYVLFALCGTALWSYGSSATSTASESLIRDQALLRKVYFPREILPVAAVFAGLVDLLPALLTTLAAAAIHGTYPSAALLALPLPILLVVLSSLGLGLGLSALNVYYRDVRYLLPFLLQIGLFASPVVFSLSVVPSRWRLVYSSLNPVATAIDDVRRAVLHHTWPAPLANGLALAFSLVLLLLGLLVFKLLERGFADRV